MVTCTAVDIHAEQLYRKDIVRSVRCRNILLRRVLIPFVDAFTRTGPIAIHRALVSVLDTASCVCVCVVCVCGQILSTGSFGRPRLRVMIILFDLQRLLRIPTPNSDSSSGLHARAETTNAGNTLRSTSSSVATASVAASVDVGTHHSDFDQKRVDQLHSAPQRQQTLDPARVPSSVAVSCADATSTTSSSSQTYAAVGASALQRICRQPRVQPALTLLDYLTAVERMRRAIRPSLIVVHFVRFAPLREAESIVRSRMFEWFPNWLRELEQSQPLDVARTLLPGSPTAGSSHPPAHATHFTAPVGASAAATTTAVDAIVMSGQLPPPEWLACLSDEDVLWVREYIFRLAHSAGARTVGTSNLYRQLLLTAERELLADHARARPQGRRGNGPTAKTESSEKPSSASSLVTALASSDEKKLLSSASLTRINSSKSGNRVRSHGSGFATTPSFTAAAALAGASNSAMVPLNGIRMQSSTANGELTEMLMEYIKLKLDVASTNCIVWRSPLDDPSAFRGAGQDRPSVVPSSSADTRNGSAAAANANGDNTSTTLSSYSFGHFSRHAQMNNMSAISDTQQRLSLWYQQQLVDLCENMRSLMLLERNC